MEWNKRNDVKCSVLCFFVRRENKSFWHELENFIKSDQQSHLQMMLLEFHVIREGKKSGESNHNRYGFGAPT